MREEILGFFRDIWPESYHIEDVPFILGYKGEEIQTYFSVLHELEEEGCIRIKGGEYGSYQKTEDTKLIGIYKASKKGFGFVIPSEGNLPDVFIPNGCAGTAMHDDEVEYIIKRKGTSERNAEGIIRRVVTRNTTRVVGIFERLPKSGFVTPHNERLGEDIYIPLECTMDARSGSTVVVELTAWPEEHRKAEGKIVEIVGDSSTPDLDVLSVMATFDLPKEFPKDVQEEARKISFTVTDESDRLDLRHIEMITIDGEDAKDLDDAVHAKVLDNGNIELGIHIADVSHYVPAGSIIDQEAYRRGTSVYLVDRVIPMLPVELSNGICSLQAKEDRYAMSCIMEVSPQGKVLHYSIKPSIIHITRRCSYKEIYLALEENIIPDDLAPLMDMVRTLETLAYQLIKMRQQAGAISFELPEYKVLLDATGIPQRIIRKDRTIAEKLIEQCMLLANETVATFLSERLDTSIYRIHEDPKDAKLEQLITVLHHSGYPVKLPSKVEPKHIEELLQSISGTEIEPVVQIMVLRSMQQAKYSSEHIGHFGLASDTYTHFTSPIRRYPDLMIHRLLRYVLGGKPKRLASIADEAYLTHGATHCSEREQIATEAERETLDMKKVQYMAQYVGESFEGHVSSITAFGLFIELDNGVDGLVPYNLMDDDHYVFDEPHYMAYGRRSGKEYHLGTPVTVTLIKADIELRQIDFVIGEVEYIDGYLRRGQERKQSLSRPQRKNRSPYKKKKDEKRNNRDRQTHDIIETTGTTKAVEQMLRKLDTKKKTAFYETIHKKSHRKQGKKQRKR